MPDGSINILLTSAGRRGALINFFRKTIRESKGLAGKVVCTDADPLSPGLYLADERHVVPRVNSDSYIPVLLDICHRDKINLLIPLIDTELLTLSTSRQLFEDIGVNVCISEPSIIEICADKYKTYKFFQENNIPTPELMLVQEALSKDIEYPIFIKPRYGSASINVFKVRNEKEFQFFLDYIPDPVIQECAQGKEYTLDILADFHGNVVRVVPRERIAVRAGESNKGITVKNDRLIELGKNVTEKLGAIGPLNIQCFMADEEIRFTEINPRFGGGLPLSLAAGANFPLLLMRMVLGEEIAGNIDDFEDGVIMLRYEDAVFINKEQVLFPDQIELE